MEKATFSSFISRNFAFSSAFLDFISLFFACIFFIYTRLYKVVNSRVPLMPISQSALARQRAAA